MDIFRVGLSPDIPRTADGELSFDLGLDFLDAQAGIEWDIIPGGPVSTMSATHLQGLDALILWGAALPAEALEGADKLKVIARLGVGYDAVDVDACTRAGIPVTITPDAVRRPMAASAMLFVLALAHRLLIKDRIVRAGGWREAAQHIGTGLTGRTLGLLGAGNIGREVFRLAKPFEMRHVAYDPFLSGDIADAEGFDLVSIEELFATADFLCVLAPLVPETVHVVNDARLALMKPSACLVSIARGPLVDEKALTRALQERRIAGAALDVFEQEPVDPANPLLALDNVILAPHSIGHTDETFRLIGASACNAVLAVMRGEAPDFVVNPETLGERVQRGAEA
jgi:phosphoglycerate dehydrogenase-like enzyme